jgi:hypothetical protein
VIRSIVLVRGSIPRRIDDRSEQFPRLAADSAVFTFVCSSYLHSTSTDYYALQ